MVKDGPFRMTSRRDGTGVPIKRVILVWTVNDPVLIPLRKYNYQTEEWQRFGTEEFPELSRVYQGDDNHHIEIRENASGEWSGKVIRTFDAAKRVRIAQTEAVDRTDNPKTGRFVMSLSEGETVWMRHKETNEAGYFVVVKLDKPQTIQFKLHWDARRAKGEKNEDGEIIPDSVRQTVPVSASQLKDLAPPGEATPVKVRVNPLGHIWPLEPSPERKDDEVALDSAFRLLPVKRLHSAPAVERQ